jgi:hypothetical protein
MDCQYMPAHVLTLLGRARILKVNGGRVSKKSEPDPEGTNTSEAARALGASGAKKGGIARSNVLSPEQRRDIARQAVRARWMKAGKLKQIESEIQQEPKGVESPRTTEEGHPFSLLTGVVRFGPIEMEAHVLSDYRRVFTQREVVRALSGGRESGNLERYLSRNPLTANNLIQGPDILFKIPGPGALAIGSEATKLIEICDKYMEAAELNLLKASQKKLAKQAGIIMRASAKIGIIALVDEATGFQKLRAKHELQLKLQAFIADEMQDWARMFPEEFWLELARLEGIRYSPRSRPLRWGKYVMMFVYDAIDKDIGRTLREKNPNPRYQMNHHQWLKQFGRERVHDQLERVVTIMKLCDNMEEFRQKFARVFKKTPLQLDINWGVDPSFST